MSASAGVGDPERDAKNMELELARAKLQLAQVELENARSSKKGFRALFTPTGVVLLAAAIGLAGTLLQKSFDQRIASRAQQTSVILKASEVPTTLPEAEQAKQRARNLLWFSEAEYIHLSDSFKEELRRVAQLDANQAVPVPVIQAASSTVDGPAPTYNFRIMNSRPVNRGGWDIDIFSCTGEGPQFDRASAFAQRIAEAADGANRPGGFSLGRIRFDAGPQHARPGNIIFFDEPEEVVGQFLSQSAVQMVETNFALRPNNERPTPSYLSVYFCGG